MIEVPFEHAHASIFTSNIYALHLSIFTGSNELNKWTLVVSFRVYVTETIFLELFVVIFRVVTTKFKKKFLTFQIDTK